MRVAAVVILALALSGPALAQSSGGGSGGGAGGGGAGSAGGASGASAGTAVAAGCSPLSRSSF